MFVRLEKGSFVTFRIFVSAPNIWSFDSTCNQMRTPSFHGFVYTRSHVLWHSRSLYFFIFSLEYFLDLMKWVDQINNIWTFEEMCFIFKVFYLTIENLNYIHFTSIFTILVLFYVCIIKFDALTFSGRRVRALKKMRNIGTMDISIRTKLDVMMYHITIQNAILDNK